MTETVTANRRGHTLVEMVVATAILVVAVALAMRGLLYVMVETNLADAQSELDIEVQVSMENVKAHPRMSLQLCGPHKPNKDMKAPRP